MVWIRKLFGSRTSRTYEIEDPRPQLKLAPYTFFLPSKIELAHVGLNDLVKLTIRGIPQGEKWVAERMWVRVAQRNQNKLSGELANVPDDTPSLIVGSNIEFDDFAILDIVWAKPEMAPASVVVRQYWDRCLVDQTVLDGVEKVGYIYREEPEPGSKTDMYRDSGWRVRSEQGGLVNTEADGSSVSYVALGAVLNKDDSWLHLIDASVGSRFLRDSVTGQFQQLSV